MQGEDLIKNAKLEIWENPYKERDYNIEINFPEFTCQCPVTGYPDFAVIHINYIPDNYIVELKSLKFYLNKYRNEYISHESATNKIYTDLFNLLNPRYLEVIGDWNPRGNVKTIIKVDSKK